MNLSTLKTADLLAIFNAAAGASVARFSDRQTAERRVALALALPDANVRLLSAGICPACGDRHNGLTAGRVVPSTGRVVDEHLITCHVCVSEWDSNTGKIASAKKPASASAAAQIAASWADPEVRAARLDRVGVKVVRVESGETSSFKSVAAAFSALQLPTSRIIPTRMKAKEAGEVEYAGFIFRIVR